MGEKKDKKKKDRSRSPRRKRGREDKSRSSSSESEKRDEPRAEAAGAGSSTDITSINRDIDKLGQITDEQAGQIKVLQGQIKQATKTIDIAHDRCDVIEDRITNREFVIGPIEPTKYSEKDVTELMNNMATDIIFGRDDDVTVEKLNQRGMYKIGAKGRSAREKMQNYWRDTVWNEWQDQTGKKIKVRCNRQTGAHKQGTWHQLVRWTGAYRTSNATIHLGSNHTAWIDKNTQELQLWELKDGKDVTRAKYPEDYTGKHHPWLRYSETHYRVVDVSPDETKWVNMHNAVVAQIAKWDDELKAKGKGKGKGDKGGKGKGKGGK